MLKCLLSQVNRIIPEIKGNSLKRDFANEINKKKKVCIHLTLSVMKYSYTFEMQLQTSNGQLYVVATTNTNLWSRNA